MSHLAIGLANWQITPTFFAATLSAGFGVRAAYLVQGVAMLLAAAGVAWVWRRKTDLAIRGSVLVLGTLLFTPYVMVYDLALLALPLCWLWEAGPPPRQTAGRTTPPAVSMAGAYTGAGIVGLGKSLLRKVADRPRNYPGALLSVSGKGQAGNGQRPG